MGVASEYMAYFVPDDEFEEMRRSTYPAVAIGMWARTSSSACQWMLWQEGV
jgi:hypothetical protein